MKPMNQIVVAILLLFVKSALIFKNALNVMMDIFFIKINVKFVKTHVKPVRKHQKIVHHVKSVLFNMGTLVNSQTHVGLDALNVMVAYVFLAQVVIN